MSLLPKSVVITDDTMREGLQIESADIPVDEKLRLLDALGETGARVISIGSFAHPKWTPSMACIDEIAERFVPKPGVKYTAAVFNRKGFERADRYYPKIDVRDKRHRTNVELCDTFARRNYNRTQAEQDRRPGRPGRGRLGVGLRRIQRLHLQHRQPQLRHAAARRASG